MTTSAPGDKAAAGRDRSSTGGADNVKLRIASAAVLAPLVLVCAYLGGWLFLAVCAMAAAGILWEWTRLIAGRTDARVLVPGLACLAIAVALTGTGQPGAAAAMIAVGSVLAAGAMSVLPRRYPAPNRPLWALAGVVYAGIAFVSPALLRSDQQFGFAALVFLVAIVWTTDIFAYAVGRAVGGPLLWSTVSPKKTWAGAVGGLAGGVAAGTLVAYASGLGKLVIIGFIALILSILTQAGDLLESAIKRRFGAKDTGRLIPGHGGLMDRLDGFLVAALAALLIGLLRQGTDAPAQGLLAW